MKSIGSFALLFVLLPPSVLADNTPAQNNAANKRQGWFYPKGAIRKVDKVNWHEKSATEEHHYQEMARNDRYVELHDFDRKLSVRVYNTALYAWSASERRWYFVRNGRWEDPAKKPLDTERNYAERAYFHTESERAGFPRLTDEFEVIRPNSTSYNCIAWSLGYTDRWIWPAQNGGQVYFSDFDDLYTRHGFKKATTMSFDKSAKYDKVVLYAKANDWNILEPTHAAKQQSDGSWTSKVGKLPVIRHLHPNDLEGSSYGQPYVIYLRPKPQDKSSAASNKSRTPVIGKVVPTGGVPSPTRSGRSSKSSAGKP
jgi:hypothetical protein